MALDCRTNKGKEFYDLQRNSHRQFKELLEREQLDERKKKAKGLKALLAIGLLIAGSSLLIPSNTNAKNVNKSDKNIVSKMITNGIDNLVKNNPVLSKITKTSINKKSEKDLSKFINGREIKDLNR